MKPKKSTYLAAAVREAMARKGINQEELSKLTGFDKSKSSRLAKGTNAFDAETVECLLGVFPERATQFMLVESYIRDMTTPELRKVINVVPKTGKMPSQIDGAALTPRGLSALRHILKAAEEGHDVENIFISFAQAIGWR